MASQSSLRLWGGMFVAIPTAMPDAPLTSRLGSRAGRMTGSLSEESKLSDQSTVSRSMSPRTISVIDWSRHSVYRMAAGGSPSTEPKLP